MARKFDLANMGRLSSGNVEEDVDLLGSGIRGAFSSGSRAIIAVLLQQQADILQGVIEFVQSIKFTELELGRVHDLVEAGVAGTAFHVDGANKEVERCGEGKQHIWTGGSGFGLNVSKASGGKENTDAFANLIAVERLASFLWEHLQQVVGIRRARQFDGFDGTSGISRH